MPQSLARVLVHIIFSTKNRAPLVRPGIEKELFAYQAAIFRECRSPASIIGGTEDHLHVLCNLSRTIALCDLLEEVNFQEEYREILRRYGAEYDERYVWD